MDIRFLEDSFDECPIQIARMWIWNRKANLAFNHEWMRSFLIFAFPSEEAQTPDEFAPLNRPRHEPELFC